MNPAEKAKIIAQISSKYSDYKFMRDTCFTIARKFVDADIEDIDLKEIIAAIPKTAETGVGSPWPEREMSLRNYMLQQIALVLLNSTVSPYLLNDEKLIKLKSKICDFVIPLLRRRIVTPDSQVLVKEHTHYDNTYVKLS